VALVPWLELVRAGRVRAAWWWSYAIGAVFFLGSMWWLIHVTVVGWLILCAYLACYFGVFGWFVHRAAQSPVGPLQRLMLIAAAWVALEYARAHVFSGFGWNLLAYSQTPWHPLIQVADVTGAWGVSFVIVVVNVAIAAGLRAMAQRRPRHKRRTARVHGVMPQLAVASIILLIVLGYGLWRPHHVALGAPIRVAVVQGNIPQEQKWDQAHVTTIMERYEALSRQAASTAPQLIVWPETSVPGYVEADAELTAQLLELVKRIRIPLLVGAPMVRGDPTAWFPTNSAVLIDDLGRIKGRYDKIHLVPFGEFIPLERRLPWLRTLLPPIGDFVSGREHTVFPLSVSRFTMPMPGGGGAGAPRQATVNLTRGVSALICFEDVFPELARRFVRKGAQLLVVITNDAWFGPTAAAYQHAQASTFRAVELRVPVARAANTGWSGCIDVTGRWVASVQDPQGRELFVDGTQTCELRLGTVRTLALHWGDWCALVCVLAVVAWLSRHRLVHGKKKAR
jgi:apolipoprotein N-acyltransferase